MLIRAKVRNKWSELKILEKGYFFSKKINDSRGIRESPKFAQPEASRG